MFVKKTGPKSFWITNFSNRNVSLADLNITLPAGKSIDLLAYKGATFGLAELEKSLTSGSLYHKKHLVSKRLVPPGQPLKNEITDTTYRLVPKPRSVIEIKEEQFDELNISDEQFADQQAELSEDRRKDYR